MKKKQSLEYYNRRQDLKSWRKNYVCRKSRLYNKIIDKILKMRNTLMRKLKS